MNETKLTWNQQGVAGLQGIQGIQGVQGPVGPTEGVASKDSESFVQDPATFSYIDTYRALRESFSDDGGAAYPYGDDFESTFTTTRAGKLFVTLRVNVSLGCVGWMWIKIDGQPVQGSLTRVFEDGQFARVLTGVTSSSVAAGQHTMDFGASCSSGTIDGTQRDWYATGTAVVLGG
jgi:hypothetical protein